MALASAVMAFTSSELTTSLSQDVFWMQLKLDLRTKIYHKASAVLNRSWSLPEWVGGLQKQERACACLSSFGVCGNGRMPVHLGTSQAPHQAVQCVSTLMGAETGTH